MKRKMKKPIWVLSVLFVAVVLYFVNNPSALDEIYDLVGLNSTVVNGKLNMYFIDTGQSDATLITDGNYSALIDSGDVDTCEKVVSFIKSKNISKLDLVILSHPHSDHMGGMPDVLEEFQIGKFIMSDIPEEIIPTNKTFDDMLDVIEKKQISSEYAEKGKTFTLGDMVFKFLSPVNEYEDLNNMTTIVRLTYGKNSFLFCGDAEKQVENDILEDGSYISSDLIKVGHHGSNTSSTEKFIKAVSPVYAVICVGEDNTYGHPADEVIERYEEMETKIYRTDLNGTVTVVCDGEIINITTEK